MRRIFSWLPGFVVGVVISSIAAFAHADRIKVGDYKVHYGLVLAPALLLVSQRWVMSHYKNRVSGIAFGFAWLITTIRLAVPNSDGDLAFGANWYSTYYLGICALTLSMSAVIAPRSARISDLDNLTLVEN